MRLRNLSLVMLISGVALLLTAASTPETKPASEWSMNATIIEACSCPMFCQCYFNAEPAVHTGDHGVHKGHQQGHYCRFNNAYKVNRGHYGETKLDGAKFWIAGDLGADFSKMETDWAVLTFDPSVTKEQREGIVAAVTKVYPVKWKSFNVAADSKIDWNATADRAMAKLDGGKIAEVELVRFPGMSSEPVVIKNLRYFGAPRNDGFVMMPNTVEAYKVGEKAFEYRGTNGFMITFDVSSKDFPAPATGSSPASAK